MRRLFMYLCLALALPALAQGHFVFVVPQPEGASAIVFISETLEPDSAVDIGLVSGTKLSLRDASGREASAALVKFGNVYSVPVTGAGTRVLHGLTDIGISGPPDKPYLLLYYPKTILGDPFDTKTTVGATPVEIIPQGKAGALTLKLVAHGKPLAGGEITVILPDGKQRTVKTDQAGQTEVFAETGRYGAWARFWETGAAGERNGKKYAETHHYATLVFETAGGSAAAKPAPSLATLPQATASFGAVASGGWLYVYGGHVSPTHDYFIEAVSGRFDRLRLTGEPVWEQLPAGPAMQGMNLAAHESGIYRIGGMVPRNKRGEPADNHSVSDAARFDLVAKKWEALTPLPVPRSSHDVVVIGDQLYVVGGWNMTGKGETWTDTLLVMDLSAQAPSWTSVPQPFKRRALMAAAFDGQLYVIGGINDKGVVERTVSIYDPKTKIWSDGPQLPEGRVLGFAPAAGVHQGSLYVSIADGTLLRLNRTGSVWESVGRSTPRVAHRLASRGNIILIVGGAANGKNSDLIEEVSVKQ
jgi:hypothetical protein